jgi:gamma-glutamyltranspeptidase/glutathione hydrolase
MSNFSKNQQVFKSVVSSEKGVVSTQSRRASEVGARILLEGGNIIDSAIATSFALGVAEPWMSGPGGGGFMVIKMKSDTSAKVINFGMKSPQNLDPRDYPLCKSGKSSDLFPWPSVVDDRNVTGGGAVAVPGQVDGMRLAHENYGSLTWSDLLQPAISLAKEGLLVDWYAQVMISSVAEALARFPKSKDIFLTETGYPKTSAWTALRQEKCDMTSMAQMLENLACKGAREFYEGDVAHSIVKEVQAEGGSLSIEDMESYQAHISDSLDVKYKDAIFYLTPEMTAGPSLAMALSLLEKQELTPKSPGKETYFAYAKSLKDTYSYRLKNDGDSSTDKLDSCTTHFCIVDTEGNMVSVTQTLLSVFGSRLALPSTGILMNNGIMWFDPEPGKPNSIGPDKRCLSNMCPIIIEKADKNYALGAAGGRKIFPAVFQLSSFLVDYNMSIEDAFHTQRIDVSSTESIIADNTLANSIIRKLNEVSPVTTAPRTAYPYNFACPSGVARESNNMNYGMTETKSVWADSVSECEVN